MSNMFKSSVTALIRSFVVWLLGLYFAIFAVVVGLGMFVFDLKKEFILSWMVLIPSAIVAICFATYLAFIHHNKQVEVTKDSVNFHQGQKRYLVLTKDKFHFTSFVHRTFTPLGIFTARYLRAVNKKNNKWKDYRLYFSKRRFESLMLAVNVLNEEVINQVEVNSEKEE